MAQGAAKRDDAARRRGRLLRTNAATGYALKAVTVACGYLSLPATVALLGEPLYVDLMALLGPVMLLSVSDLGLGNALVERVAGLGAKGDAGAIRELVRSAVRLTAIVSLLAVLLATLLLYALPIHNFLRSRGQEDPLRQACIVALCLVALNSVTGIFAKAQQGLQRMHRSNLASSISIAAATGLLLALRTSDAAPMLIVVLSLAPIAVTNGFAMRDVWKVTAGRAMCAVSAPRASYSLIRDGGLYLVVQVVLLASAAVDALLGNALLDSKEMTAYLSANRLYSLLITMFLPFVGAQWAAYADAWHADDIRWIRSAFQRTTWAVFGLSLAGGLALHFNRKMIYRFWDSRLPVPSGDLTVALTILAVFLAVGSCTGMVANALSDIRPQAIGGLLILAIGIPLKLVLIRTFGSPGLAVGQLVPYGIYLLWYFGRIQVLLGSRKQHADTRGTLSGCPETSGRL